MLRQKLLCLTTGKIRRQNIRCASIFHFLFSRRIVRVIEGMSNKSTGCLCSYRNPVISMQILVIANQNWSCSEVEIFGLVELSDEADSLA